AVGILPNAPDSRGWEDDLVVGGLDVGRRQGRAVVEPDSLPELERVGEPVWRDLPLGRRVADDLRIAERVDLDQRAVERRHQLDGGEGLLLMRIEARRVGRDGGEQDAAAARRLRLDRGRRHHDQGADQYTEPNDGDNRPMASHLNPPTATRLGVSDW